MRTFKDYIVKTTSIVIFIIVLSTFLFLQSCKSDTKETQHENVVVEKENVIEIITKNMDFQMPDTISSGWNTFRYKNLSPQTHFFLVDKYPLQNGPMNIASKFTTQRALLNIPIYCTQ